MTSKTQKGLGPSGTPSKSNVAGSIQIQTYCITITTQPIVNGITLVSDLPTVQHTAIDHANQWLNGYVSELQSMMGRLSDFSGTYNSYYAPLLHAATQLENSTTKQEKNHWTPIVKEGLGQLMQGKSGITQFASDAKNWHKTLDGWRTSLETDAGKFTTEANKAIDEITSNKGEISQLEKTDKSLQTAINKDIAMVAGGAVMDVVGGLMIAVGAVGDFVTAGTSTPLVVAGLAVVAGGSTMMGIAGHNMHDDINKLASNKAEIKKLHQDVTVLNTVDGQLSGFHQGAIAAVAGAENLANSLSDVNSGFEAYLSELNSGNFDPSNYFLSSALKSAKGDWDNAANDVKNLQHYMRLQVAPNSKSSS